MSIRSRLALWYGGLLALVLAVTLTVAFAVHVRTHESDRERAVCVRHGIRLTTPEQTFIDMGSYLDLVGLVVRRSGAASLGGAEGCREQHARDASSNPPPPMRRRATIETGHAQWRTAGRARP